MNPFAKQTPQEQAKEASRQVASNQRGIDREVQRLKREEAKCEAAIKAAAKKPGGAENAKTLARSLVQIREQIGRLTKASARVGSVANSARMAGSTATVVGAMANTAKVMGSVNKATDGAAATMAQFAQQCDHMAMHEQMMDEAFEALDADADWEEEDETLAMVMDELGLEVAGQMSAVPKTQAAAAAQTQSQSQPAGAQSVAAAGS